MLPPLLFYAGLCTLALLVWPGTKTRYAMPVAPAMAVMAGLAIEPLWRRRHWAAAVALATAVILFVYQVALVTVALPRLAEHVSTTRRLGAALDAAVRAAPAPVFVIDAPQSNKLFYVTWPVRTLPLADCILPAPAWVLAPRSKLGQIELLHPDLTVQEVPTALPGPGLVLARIERRPNWDEAP